MKKPRRASGSSTLRKASSGEARRVAADLQRPLADGLEGGAQRLHRERQRIDHRADDEAGEGEGQGADAEGVQRRHQRAVRAQRDQQVEAQHRRRQHDRHRRDRGHRLLQPGAAPRQPPGERRRQHQQDCRRDSRELSGEPDGVLHASPDLVAVAPDDRQRLRAAAGTARKARAAGFLSPFHSRIACWSIGACSDAGTSQREPPPGPAITCESATKPSSAAPRLHELVGLGDRGALDDLRLQPRRRRPSWSWSGSPRRRRAPRSDRRWRAC